MTTIDPTKLARLNLRFDDTLRQQLERAAQRSERSLNREIIYRLKRTFDREPIEAAA
jgi:predicted HicB family RNase H-like nuclease